MTTNPNIVTIGIGGDPLPREGQRVIGPFQYDFAAFQSYAVNLRAQMENLSLMSFALACYIDNSANVNPVTLNSAGQLITVKGTTQGWYPLISQRPIQYSISCAGPGITNLFFANFHTPGFQWGTTPGAGPGISQTPWLSNIDANGFALSNVPTVSGNGGLTLASGGANPVTLASALKFPDGTIQSTAGGGSQSPWLGDIEAASHNLNNLNALFFGNIAGAYASIDYSNGLRFYGINLTSSMLIYSLSAQGGVAWLADLTGHRFQTNNLTRLTIDAAGHLIIPLPDDSAPPLQVTGQIQTSGGIKFGDGTIQTTAATGGTGGGISQTPWIQQVDAANFALINLPSASASAGQDMLFRSNNKTRAAIRSGGALDLQPDDFGECVLTFNNFSNHAWLRWIVASGVLQLSGDAPVQIGSLAEVDLTTAGKNRLTVDATGHVVINAPDSGLTASLKAMDEIRIETAKANANFIILGPTASNRNLAFGDTNPAKGYRWTFACDNSAESGSNAGSNFFIARWSDVGAYIDNPFFISRNSGFVTVGAAGGGTAGTWNAAKLQAGAGGVQFNDATVQLTAAPPVARTIAAGAGLSGGGDLSANRTLAVTAATAGAIGGVKIGANVTVQPDGTISVAAPTAALVPATAGVLGGVKIGANVTVQADGTISVPAQQAGVTKTFQTAFTTSGNFNPSAALLAAGGCVCVTLVGGGGGGGTGPGGGTAGGGGGGGGGVIWRRWVTVAGLTAVTVGGGGAVGAPASPGSPGGNSTFGALTAFGGQGGGGNATTSAMGGASGAPTRSGAGPATTGGGGAGGIGSYAGTSAPGSGGPGILGYGGGGGNGTALGSCGGADGASTGPAPAPVANSGGGGGGSTWNASLQAGSAGAAGFVLVEWME